MEGVDAVQQRRMRIGGGKRAGEEGAMGCSKRRRRERESREVVGQRDPVTDDELGKGWDDAASLVRPLVLGPGGGTQRKGKERQRHGRGTRGKRKGPWAGRSGFGSPPAFRSRASVCVCACVCVSMDAAEKARWMW